MRTPSVPTNRRPFIPASERFRVISNPRPWWKDESRLSQWALTLSQVGLLVLALFTVPPIYQNARLNEKNAQLEAGNERLTAEAKALRTDVGVVTAELAKARHDRVSETEQFYRQRSEQAVALSELNRKTVAVELQYKVALESSNGRRREAEARAATSQIEIARYKALQMYIQQATTRCVEEFGRSGSANGKSIELCLRAPVWSGSLQLSEKDKAAMERWIVAEARHAASSLSQLHSDAISLGWAVVVSEMQIQPDACASLTAQGPVVKIDSVEFGCEELQALARTIARSSSYYSAIEHATSQVASGVLNGTDPSVAHAVGRPLAPAIVSVE